MVAPPSLVRGGFDEIGEISECAFLFRLHRGPEGPKTGNGELHIAHAFPPSLRAWASR